MPKRYSSYSPGLERPEPLSAYLVQLLGGLAFGICTAIGVLYLLRNAQERPVTPFPIYATATARIPVPETVELAETRFSAPTGDSTAGSASENNWPKAPTTDATAGSAAENNRPTWSLQLIGDSSETRALAEYSKLQKRFPAILGSRTPVVLKKELGGRGSASWYQIRLTEDSRERADALCIQLRSAGGECLVLSD
jgi:hypothetical protein